jgi:hypothetical protein
MFMKKAIYLMATAFWGIFLFAFCAGAEDVFIKANASTDSRDQKAVSITIYNINMGLVKDVRAIDLKEGMLELKFMDVASSIIPSSVHIKSLIEPESLFVLEQNYEYDLLSPQKLMEKYVGKNVRLYQKNPYTDREEEVEATLLSNNGGPVFKIRDDITFGHPGRVLFPKVPEDLISKPTLVWLLENGLPKTQTVEVSYLTDNIKWRADYVLTLNDKDTMGDLSGWVTIENRSGAAYKNANVKLVAGDVERVREEMEYAAKGAYRAYKAEAPAQFKEEGFFEYHIYTLQRPSTIKDNQTKQISLITADGIPLKKEFIYYGAQYYYRNRYGEKISDQKIGVYVVVENKKDNNLGMPLPKGVVRVYKKDSEGSLQFVGENSIDHTPKDEKIKLKVGNAFDIVGERRQMDWRKIADDLYEAEFKVLLRNHKDEDVTVNVIEPIYGDWEMLSSSHPYIKTEAHTAEFSIRAPKDKEVKLTYRVRMRF